MLNFDNFKGDLWKKDINVRDFIQSNYTPYLGDEDFLEVSSNNTREVWNRLTELFKIEKEKGIYDVETKKPQDIDTYGAGYIAKEFETIVGLQTDVPLKRAIFPKGGLRMVKQSLKAFGYELDPFTEEIFTKYRKTHNNGVFSAYTDEMIRARKSGIITGLPDAYSRGRIIGDYRRVPLYGTDRLIKDKITQLKSLDNFEINDEVIRRREELSEEISSLKKFINMCASYGFDVSSPANSSKEAVQFLYFAYLAATKDQDGAAMSLGRTATFLDIYIERDIENGAITELEAQELIDQFIIKLRIIRFLRTPEYDSLFSGDPTWITEVLGGQGIDGRTLVTKTSFRYLQTLYNLGPAPEPNLTILWSNNSPTPWKAFCVKVSIDSSSIQYENDDLMRVDFGDDYGIACCVSPMKIGKGMQFFGARTNLPKALLLALNGGKDEITGEQISPCFAPITSEYLQYEDVMSKFEQIMKWLARVYVDTLKVIHYMHDKYSYESFEMALHDLNIERTQATGIAGLSIVVDSLVAIRDAKVKVIRDSNNIITDFEIEGDYIPFGNDEDSTDMLASKIVEKFMQYLGSHNTYRNSKATQSILTITSNIVYGKKTGNTPDGRKKGTPFSPGTNPMNGRDTRGAIASLLSVSKIPFSSARDGISYTFAITPEALGKNRDIQIENLISLLDGYFLPQSGQHLNINVFNREILEDAMKSPDKYPQLTIRVSGYAVNFIKLSKEQQLDILSRTINSTL